MTEVGAVIEKIEDSTDEPERRARQHIPYFGLTLVGFFLFLVLFGPWIAPHDPYEADLSKAIQPPCWQEDGSLQNILGTDAMGRDIFSRLVFGARITLVLSLGCIAFYGIIGVIMGLISGYFGGMVDISVMRLTDLWMSMPGIVMAILLVSVMGPGIKTIIVVVGIIGWPSYARIVRGECLSLKQRDFIRLAKVSGCSNLRIMFSHIFPNVINTLIILVTLDVGQIIVLTATLSFLGLGTQPPSTDWGLMLFEGRQYFTYAWWLVTFPGIAILVAVLGFNMTGDWLRDVLDPKQKLR